MTPFKKYIILDVRPRTEYHNHRFDVIHFPVPIASINGSTRAQIYNDLVEFMRGRPRDACVLVYGTHGPRIKMIVEFLVDMGWRRVFNI